MVLQLIKTHRDLLFLLSNHHLMTQPKRRRRDHVSSYQQNKGYNINGCSCLAHLQASCTISWFPSLHTPARVKLVSHMGTSIPRLQNPWIPMGRSPHMLSQTSLSRQPLSKCKYCRSMTGAGSFGGSCGFTCKTRSKQGGGLQQTR